MNKFPVVLIALLSAFLLFFGLAQTGGGQTGGDQDNGNQADAPILVFISWDGSLGWVTERLLGEGKLPNLRRLADRGVYVRRTIGNWPSVTATGHAAVFTGAYGSVNGVTGNGAPVAPFDAHAIGEGTTSQ